jgi:hypothetical protein
MSMSHYLGKYSAKVEEKDIAELDRKTDSLLQIAAIAGRVATAREQGGERPTRRELDALDGLYADATGAKPETGESEKKVRTLLI